MDDQSQSLDALLQLTHDFRVPDQLFDDGDMGVEDLYNTVEIETNNETNDLNAENIVGDGGDLIMMSIQSAAETSSSPTETPQVDNSVVNQRGTPVTQISEHGGLTDAVSQKSGSTLLSLVATSSQPSQSMGTPLVTSVPLAIPTTIPQTPLKMVTVPVNSDIITQGNSQVVLIPMGGMDCSRLESSLKVPLGQKLVIIKPQEIIKTIEAKKSQKVQSPVTPQQGIVVQGTTQAGFQRIQASPLGTVGVVGGGTIAAQKGLVQLRPKTDLLPQRVYSSNPVQQVVTVQKPKTLTQHVVKTGMHTNTVQQKVSSSAINRAGNTRPASTILSSSSAVKPQTVPNATQQSGKSRVTTSQSGLTTFQARQTTSRTGLTNAQTGLTSAQKTGVTISTASLTTSQTGPTTSETGLTTSQVSSTASQEQPTTAEVKQVTSNDLTKVPSSKPNLTRPTKQIPTQPGQETSTAMSKPNESTTQGVATTSKPTQVQNTTPVTKTPQKVVVTYVSPPKSNKNRTDPVIQIPAKLEGQKRVLNTSNGSRPRPISQPASGQQQKMVPTITTQIRHVKKNDEMPSTSSTSTTTEPSASEQTNFTSIEEGKEPLNNVAAPKRGRPRKNPVEETSTRDVKKTISGPTLRHELERSSVGSAKPKEYQLRAVKHKRVSNTNPWTCALCGKGSYANSLGCLYGPYDGDSDVAVGDGGEPQHKRRRGSSEDGSPRKATSESVEELWFHGQCMVWSPGVYVLGEALAGYKQVVSDAQTRTCNYCGNNGATLVCMQRACKKQYHFFCATKTGCVFEESNYTIQCGKHKK